LIVDNNFDTHDQARHSESIGPSTFSASACNSAKTNISITTPATEPHDHAGVIQGNPAGEILTFSDLPPDHCSSNGSQQVYDEKLFSSSNELTTSSPFFLANSEPSRHAMLSSMIEDKGGVQVEEKHLPGQGLATTPSSSLPSQSIPAPLIAPGLQISSATMPIDMILLSELLSMMKQMQEQMVEVCWLTSR
jgi:hypothetical protein